jgi:DNA-binding protein H-NS
MDMATLQAVQAKIKKLQAQAESMIAKESSAVIANIRSLMAKHGLTTADIDAHTGRRKRGRPSLKSAGVQTKGAAKYRDPKTGATWTGHGRAPGWIASAKDRSRFLVAGAKTSLAASVSSKAVASHNGHKKGPQPAKYRHPVTGATWSGRGPAPAWLAAEKDRTKFLIAHSKAAGAGKRAGKKAAAN